MIALVGAVYIGSAERLRLHLRLQPSRALAPADAGVEGAATAAPPAAIGHVMEVACIVGAFTLVFNIGAVRDIRAGLLPPDVQVERGHRTAAPGYRGMLARVNPRDAVAHDGLLDGYGSK